ncbi:T6SS effector amidase Tae4 family protein [Cronobacter malonaticus]|uniref:T6SS effector amidase Tae4 family protein n=1 Tax=Cronobacter malonaticus TaxID=413503 RepID=UPI003743FA1D
MGLIRDFQVTITFSQLWEAHPEINGDADPCRKPDGHKAFNDQCAIRLGVALTRCGYDVSRLKLAQCWYHPKAEGHVLRAEELANALKKRQSRAFSERLKSAQIISKRRSGGRPE